MTPTDQEFIHDPENGQHGDCQRAVIASLLDLPITAVPHFLQEAAGDPSTYWEKLRAFLRSHDRAAKPRQALFLTLGPTPARIPPVFAVLAARSARFVPKPPSMLPNAKSVANPRRY